MRTVTRDVRPLTGVPRHPDGRVDVDALVAALRRTGPVHVVEPRLGVPGADRWCYLVALSPGEVVDDGRRTRLRLEGLTSDLGCDPFAALEGLADRFGWDPARPADSPPFGGGAIGWFAYDLARRIERIGERAEADRPCPAVWLALADLVVAIDQADAEAWLVVRPLGPDPTPRIAALRAALEQPGLIGALPPSPRSHVTTSLPPHRYRRAVAQVLAHIAAGDVYQVNLTQRLTARWPGDVHSLYRALRAHSPAPYGLVLDTTPGVASISPETFLSVRGGVVRCRPIKGTRPRHSDPAADLAAAAELCASAKDRAENVMIVDLVRNDLGRVCRTGTVRVTDLCHPEAHPTVWQLTSTVTGVLAAGVGYGALLRACLPCGSVTGAPKVRAMQLIEELEPVRRGIYCGALGWLSDGAAELSVAIRTAVWWPDQRVDYGAGGGIVADSDPDAEHAESLAKARAFLLAVGGRAPR